MADAGSGTDGLFASSPLPAPAPAPKPVPKLARQASSSSPRVHFRRITRYGVLGVAFDYRLSYSFHRVRAKAIRRALRVARACRRSGGELRIVRRRLVCQNR